MNGKSYTIQTTKVYALKRSVDEPGDVTDLVVRKIPWTFDTSVPLLVRTFTRQIDSLCETVVEMLDVFDEFGGFAYGARELE